MQTRQILDQLGNGIAGVSILPREGVTHRRGRDE